MYRDPLPFQHLLEGLVPSAHRPQQDHHVRVSGRPQESASFVHHLVICQQSLDLSSHNQGFRLLLIQFLPRARLLHQQQFTSTVFPFRIGRSRRQGCPVIIVDSAHCPAHQPGKHIVHCIHHLDPAPEILRQINPAADSFRSIGIVFFQEQFRPSQPELIDALLHIPYHKPVEVSVLLPGDSTQKILLHQVAVLIFINENLCKMLPVFPGHRAGPYLRPLPYQQDIQGKMLHIGEVDHLLLLFFLLHPSSEFQYQSQKDIHRLSACPVLAQCQGQGGAENLLCQPLDAVLHFPSHPFGQFPLPR